MLVCNMHPTVLHEDSTLTSGDFPAMVRQYLQKTILGGCPVVYHTGPCGNQSPRRVARANTFAEAQRLGEAMGASAAAAIETIRYERHIAVSCRQAFADLSLREFPSEADAEAGMRRAEDRFQRLQRSSAEHGEVRTAECDWFGAEETLALARAARSGKLQTAAAECLPAEIQMIRLGPWTFVGWQGEAFVEFALEVERIHSDTYVISLANGELQGYLVTAETVAERGYEASNALFRSPDSGNLLVQQTLGLLKT